MENIDSVRTLEEDFLNHRNKYPCILWMAGVILGSAVIGFRHTFNWKNKLPKCSGTCKEYPPSISIQLWLFFRPVHVSPLMWLQLFPSCLPFLQIFQSHSLPIPTSCPSPMAETSALFFSPFSSSSSSYFISSLSRSKESSSTYTSLFSFRRFSLPRLNSSSRSVRFSARASDSGGNFLGDDSFGFYPWESSNGDGGIQWVPEEKITLFTADGLIQIGGSMVPRRIPSSDRKQGKVKNSQRFQRYQESDYMDPAQGLCLGALFDIAATNGLDTGRRLCIIGFCRSIEMLSDVVEDTVLEHGGEVVTAEKASKGGLQEKLTMTVAVPLLWGVPPASETLHLAVRSGGGIVDKVFWQWDFL